MIQEEVKNKRQQELVRGTAKAAVLEGDPDCPKLVAISVYDTKPVNILSIACTNLEWVEKQKTVWDKDAGATVSMKFLRPGVINVYNNGMNNVDQADQLRGSYRIDRWMRKRKWRWAIWMWGVQVLLVNAYMLYKSAHLFIWKTPAKFILSQYDFRHAIALKWLGVEHQSANPSDNEGSEPKRRKSDAISLSSAYSTDTLTGKRATYVTDAALDPLNGSLRQRLNEFTDHYPERSKLKAPCCSLCCLVENQKFNNDVVCCDDCKVQLCIDCFKPLNMQVGKNIEERKSNLKKG